MPEFDSIFVRFMKAGLSYGSARSPRPRQAWNGGRGVYFKNPNDHVFELMTVPQ
jgi:hypothetical protein